MATNIERSKEVKSGIYSEKYTRYASKGPTLIFEYVSILGVDIEASMVIEMAESFLRKFYYNPSTGMIDTMYQSELSTKHSVRVEKSISKYFDMPVGTDCDIYMINTNIQETYDCLHPEDKESYLKEILTLVHNIGVAYYADGWYHRKDD